MNNKIEIGKRYFMNGTEVEALAYIPENEILIIKENNGDLFFVLGDFNVKDNKIIAKETIGFTVSESEMLDCINTYTSQTALINKDMIVKAIRNTYYKIPTKIAEVIAQWFLM